jgi:hypothetical protein
VGYESAALWTLSSGNEGFKILAHGSLSRKEVGGMESAFWVRLVDRGSEFRRTCEKLRCDDLLPIDGNLRNCTSFFELS